MPVEVHAEALKRRFVAPWLSLACLLNLLVLVGAFVLPVYICWATGLWQETVVRYEQPRVAFSSAFVVQFAGLKGAAAGGYRAPFVAAYSSSPAANDLYGAEALRGMVVRASTDDANFDGVADALRLTASMPLAADETVLSATVVAFVDVKLQVRRAARAAPRGARAGEVAR